MEKLENCPSCQQSNSQEYLALEDYSVSKEAFTLCQCNNCSLVYTNPRPAEPELGKYYESEDYISHTNSKETLFDKFYHLSRKYMLSKKYQILLKNGKVASLLDIGSGTGAFLKFAQDQGIKAEGMEPSDKARKIAEELTGSSLHTDLHQINDKKFDCISLWHVLEHLPNLTKDLQKIKTLLNPDGQLVIAVPNLESYDAKKYGKYWAAYDVPRHLYHFSKKSIDRCLESQGFKKIATKGMPLDSFYVSLLSEKYHQKGESKIRAGIRGLMSNIAGLNGPNHSSLIHIYKKVD